MKPGTRNGLRLSLLQDLHEERKASKISDLAYDHPRTIAGIVAGLTESRMCDFRDFRFHAPAATGFFHRALSHNLLLDRTGLDETAGA
jgi:hypothetical protein